MAAMKPRPAATLALLRDASGGPQVLMLQRTQSAAFLGGAYVFAGGALDAGDDDGRIMARVRGLSAIEARAIGRARAATRAQRRQGRGAHLHDGRQGAPAHPARAELARRALHAARAAVTRAGL